MDLVPLGPNVDRIIYAHFSTYKSLQNLVFETTVHIYGSVGQEMSSGKMQALVGVSGGR